MLSVSVQELKQKLSELLRRAAGGERILITRHNKPVASLSSAELEHVHVGERYGRARLRACLRRATGGRYLDVLAEDRARDR